MTNAYPLLEIATFRVAPYPQCMGKKSLAELTVDPFLRTLEGRDDAQLLTVEQTAGFLARSITTLAEWRASGKRPPGWIDDAGIRYPLGEVRRYAREQLERLALTPTPPAPSPPPAPTTAAEEIAKAVDQQAVDDYGLDDPILTGRRRKGVRHNSFAEFVALGAADDEWVFLMVPVAQGGHRPVDLISTLDISADQVAEAACAQMSLTEYLRLLKEHLNRYQNEMTTTSFR
ncbi:hypothetical protein ACFONN_10190 [Dyella humi]|uniref:DNA-binding protein n=1 Tax=Dyella humi TaxID=1770547 RepID=A0ABW8IKQ4_9GAMM